jgi:hypothetical protein
VRGFGSVRMILELSGAMLELITKSRSSMRSRQDDIFPGADNPSIPSYHESDISPVRKSECAGMTVGGAVDIFLGDIIH